MTTTITQPALRVPHHDVAEAYEQLRSGDGLFIATTRAVPVGSACRLEIVAPGQRETMRIDALVVARREVNARHEGLVVRAAGGAMRTATAAPAASTRDLLARVQTLLAGDASTFDLPSRVTAGERVRINYGTTKWPAAVTIAVVARDGARVQSDWRCDVLLDPEVDPSQPHVFAARMATLVEARETSETFRRWRPEVVRTQAD